MREIVDFSIITITDMTAIFLGVNLSVVVSNRRYTLYNTIHVPYNFPIHHTVKYITSMEGHMTVLGLTFCGKSKLFRLFWLFTYSYIHALKGQNHEEKNILIQLVSFLGSLFLLFYYAFHINTGLNKFCPRQQASLPIQLMMRWQLTS